MGTVLGLDTSCYTTSAALADENGLIGQKRRLLSVELGGRGLMQSEGVFQHVTRLPQLVEELMREHPVKIDAVCASTRPRPVEDSYMPVFTVGTGYGRSIAAVMGVPFFETSHQQGHIRAALVDTALENRDVPFLALHLSGGTTEVVRVQNGTIELIGGSNDLHAGQFIDRVGVRLGLPFPAGPELEKMARQGQAQAQLPIWVRGSVCSFSGSESASQRMIDAGTLSPNDMAAEVFSCVARSITKMLYNAAEQTGIKRLLIAGGVASSTLLRELVGVRMKKLDHHVKLNWGRPELSGDNACGVALLGVEQFMK